MREISVLEDYEIVDAALRDRLAVLKADIDSMTGGGKPHTQVSCIIGDGNSYIDTGICPSPYYTVEISMRLPSVTTSAANPVFGLYDDLANYAMYFSNNEYGGYLYVNRSIAYDQRPSVTSGNYAQSNAVDAPHIFEVRRQGLFIDGVIALGLYAPIDATPFSHTLYLFTINNNGGVWSYKGNMECYYVKIRDDEDILVRDMIPVVKSDGTVCMYDNVSQEYFYNLGDGAFGYVK